MLGFFFLKSYKLSVKTDQKKQQCPQFPFKFYCTFKWLTCSLKTPSDLIFRGVRKKASSSSHMASLSKEFSGCRPISSKNCRISALSEQKISRRFFYSNKIRKMSCQHKNTIFQAYTYEAHMFPNLTAPKFTIVFNNNTWNTTVTERRVSLTSHYILRWL